MQLTQGLIPQVEAVSLNSLEQQKHAICPCNMVGKALTQKRLEGTWKPKGDFQEPPSRRKITVDKALLTVFIPLYDRQFSNC